MKDLLPFIVSGIAIGAVYGLAASGLVLTYKSSGIFNFGHGALATIAAYVFYWLHVVHRIAWPVAALASILIAGPLMGLLMEKFARRLAPQSTALKIVGTVGLILVVQGLGSIKYGTNTISVRQFLPFGADSFNAGGVVITYDYVILTALVVVVVAALYAMFRWTRIGLHMRAVVDDPDLVALHGTEPVRVRRTSWIIGCSFAALAGVLIVPLIGLDPILLTYLVVQAFAAAAIGNFSSIPGSLAGGILLGVVSNIALKYSTSHIALAGLPDAIPFLVLFVVLLVRGKRLVAPSRLAARPPLQYRAPPRVRMFGGVLLVALLVVLPNLVGDKLSYVTTGLATAMILLSLGLLVRTSGQVSLCHAAFAAIGAATFSQFVVGLGMPWVLALVLAALVVVPVGALVAIPAIRLSGLFLALATLGFGLLLQRMVYSQSWMFSQFYEGRVMPHPSFAQSPRRFYYVVVAVVLIVAAAVVAIERSRLGRMLRGLSESPMAITAMGLSVNVTRVTVFCISAFIAALSGILLGVSENYATGQDPFFSPFNSILLLAMLALAPFAEPFYAFVPAISAVVPAYIHGAHTSDWLNVIFGVGAVVVALQGGIAPLPQRAQVWLNRLGTARRRRRPAPLAPQATVRTAHSDGVELHEISVRFGGLVAVDKLSLQARPGTITGLIGPNGAGKTTAFNACSGLNRRHAGSVSLHGEDITRRPPAARARRGIGRTFQSSELCDRLTVEDNVRLSDEAVRAGANPFVQARASKSSWRATRQSALAAMRLCGIEHLASTQVATLPTGQRRLVELARCLAGPYDLLLLDEPSSGLDTDETVRFGELLARVVEERGVGILLVEHDMSLVMRLSTYVYVMDFGKLIFEGSPAQVASSDTVRAAYLGSDDVSLNAITSGEPARA